MKKIKKIPVKKIPVKKKPAKKIPAKKIPVKKKPAKKSGSLISGIVKLQHFLKPDINIKMNFSLEKSSNFDL